MGPCLRYAGPASTWGFAIYRASYDDYEKSVLPSGRPTLFSRTKAPTTYSSGDGER
jgi:hypothetical protein